MGDNWLECQRKKHFFLCKPCNYRRRRPLHGGVAPRPKRRDNFFEFSDPKLKEVRERHKKELDTINNIHTGVVEGFVYVISNVAWEGWVKIGCAIDPVDRTASYQTGSPHRDYILEGYAYSTNRRASEKAVHDALAKHRHGGEWFLCPVQEALDLVKKFCSEQSTNGKDAQ